MKQRVFRLLNLKPSDSRYIFDLLRIQLFIGIANAFITISGLSLFIYKLSIQQLPYAYLAMGVVLLLINIAYEKAEHRISPLNLLKYIILFSGLVVGLFWLGFLAGSVKALIFALLVWSMVFYMLTGYAYWGLVSLLFNVRESKRVFSIVGAGDIPAKLIGYLAAPILIPFIGIHNLLAFGLASLAISFYLVVHLISKRKLAHVKVHHHHHHHRNHFTEEKKGWWQSITRSFILQHGLLLSISALSILSYNVFNLVDYTFISQLKVKYKDLGSLSFFIATFFAVGRFLALILKLVFSSRVLERLGIIKSLLITPVVLFVCSMLFLTASGELSSSLYFLGIIVLLTEVLRSTIQEPSFLILFQPMNEQYRLRGHIIAKGYMLPFSLFLVGGGLILLQYLQIEMTIQFAVQVLLLNLCLWALIILMVKKEYVKTLHNSITKGVFSGDHVQVYDAATIDILLKKVAMDEEGESIYALKLLESAGYAHYTSLLQNCINSSKADIRKFAISQLEKEQQLSGDLLSKALAQETDNEIRTIIIANLCRLDAGFLKKMADSLSEHDPLTRKTVIIQLLDQNEFEFLFQAGKEIDLLIHSENNADKHLAIEIISEINAMKFTAAISSLMWDTDTGVKRAAIIAAGKLKSRQLLPLMMQLLNATPNRFMVLQGLLNFGEDLFRHLHEVDAIVVKKHTGDLIKIAAKCRGHHSTRFLLDVLLDKHFTEKAIHALWLKGFHAETTHDQQQFKKLLHYYLANGSEKMTLSPHVTHSDTEALIKTSIEKEIRNDLFTAMRICAILYHRGRINRVVELLESGEGKKIYNALEMLEMVLPKKTGNQINKLAEHILDPASWVGAREKKIERIYHKVLHADAHKFNSWTKAVTIFCSYLDGDEEILEELKNFHPDQSLIVTETRNFVLNTDKTHSHAHHRKSIAAS